MSCLDIKQIPVLNDNYVYLAHCPETGATAVVDPAVTGPNQSANRLHHRRPARRPGSDSGYRC